MASDVERHWPWIVLAAAVVANVLSGGVIRSYGVMYMDFRDRLETSSKETVIIGAVALGISGLIAPLAQGLSRKLNCLLVTLFGTVAMCAGFIISAFLHKVYWHIVTLGLFVGCGSGLIQIASILAVVDVFIDRPVLATALLSISFPLGTFLFGFITRGLLDSFSYFGTFLILAAIVANCIVCGLVFRPYRKKPTLDDHQSSTYKRMDNPVDDLENSKEAATVPGDEGHRETREVGSDVEDETSRIHRKGKKQYKSVTGPTEEIVVSATTDVIRFSDYVVDDEEYISSEDEEVTKPGDVKVVEEPRVEEAPPAETSAPVEPTPVHETKDVPPPTFLQSISDPKALCNWKYIVLILAIILYSMGFGIPLMYYPDLSREHDITDLRAVWTLAVVGVLSTFTIVVSEFSLQYIISNYPRTILVFIAGSTAIGGVIIALAHYYSTFETLLMSAIMFGIFSAPCRSLGTCHHVLRETTVTEDLLPFYIWGNLFSGVGFLIGLPISGVLRDLAHDYSWSFGFAGICLVLSAILSSVTACHRRAHVRLVD